LWRERVRTETKVALAVVAALALGVVGFVTAGAVTAANQPPTFTTKRVVTIVRTIRLGTTQLVTVRRVLRSPGETVTIQAIQTAGQRVVTTPGTTATVVRTVTAPTASRATDTIVRTVTVAGRPTTVTGPGATVTTPPSTVTNTVAGPASTVTQMLTVTVTRTVTQTVTVKKLPPTT